MSCCCYHTWIWEHISPLLQRMYKGRRLLYSFHRSLCLFFSQLTLLRPFPIYYPYLMSRKWQRLSMTQMGMDTLLLLLARMGGKNTIFVIRFLVYRNILCRAVTEWSMATPDWSMYWPQRTSCSWNISPQSSNMWENFIQRSNWRTLTVYSLFIFE